jgi:hypothetical protein
MAGKACTDAAEALEIANTHAAEVSSLNQELEGLTMKPSFVLWRRYSQKRRCCCELSPGEIAEVSVGLASVARTVSCPSGRAEVCVPSVAISGTTSVAGIGSCPGERAEVCGTSFARSHSTAVAGTMCEGPSSGGITGVSGVGVNSGVPSSGADVMETFAHLLQMLWQLGLRL